jgi:hypothetical protein
LNRPNAAQASTANRLLSHERAAGSGGANATTAAGRVYAKLSAHLIPILGNAGVQALMGRSFRLAQVELSDFDEVSLSQRSTRLSDWFETRNPDTETESTAAVLANFFALLTTFIGAKLTTELLRKAWPGVEGLAVSETRP